MATNFPTSIDSFTNPTSGDTLDSPSHAAQHANINDAMVAVQTKLGVGSGTIGTWTQFTPVWTATTTNPSINNGILNGRYTQVNKLVIAQYEVRMGSTTSFGAGIYKFSYPVAADTSNFFVFADIGFGRIYDSDLATVHDVHAIVDNGSTSTFVLGPDGASSQVGNSVPMTFANGDEILMTVIYRAA